MDKRISLLTGGLWLAAAASLSSCKGACEDDGFGWNQDPEACMAMGTDSEGETETDPTTTTSTPTTDPSTTVEPTGTDSETETTTGTTDPTTDPATTGGMLYCKDADGDGFGDPDDCVMADRPPDGYVPDNTDCDDTNEFTFPGSAPLDDPEACMKDEDDDDYGDDMPPGGVTPGSDCADNEVSLHDDCEDCEPEAKLCADIDELWTCNGTGTGYDKVMCDMLCDPINLVCAGPLTVAHVPESQCIELGESVLLDPVAMGGTGNYTWSWAPPETLDDPMIQKPTATPTELTTYTVTVDDGITDASAQATVIVNGEILNFDPVSCEIYTWTIYGTEQPEWVWDDAEKELCNTKNSEPSALFCGWSLDHAKVEGEVQVKTAGDDDIIGMIFGGQDTSHFYLVQWKQLAQDLCGTMTVPAGIYVKLISADDPNDLTCSDFHDPVDTPNSQILATAAEVYNTGWKDNTAYIWEIIHLGEEFTVRAKSIDDMILGEVTVMDNTYTSGFVGMYAASQAQSCFKGFSASCP